MLFACDFRRASQQKKLLLDEYELDDSFFEVARARFFVLALFFQKNLTA